PKTDVSLSKLLEDSPGVQERSRYIRGQNNNHARLSSDGKEAEYDRAVYVQHFFDEDAQTGLDGGGAVDEEDGAGQSRSMPPYQDGASSSTTVVRPASKNTGKGGGAPAPTGETTVVRATAAAHDFSADNDE
ncbi:unnamed protein product, partial [Amoebophrya sp. A120]